MKKFTKLFLALALLVVGVGAANAGAKKYWEPSTAFGASWDGETNKASWTKNGNGWYLLYTGFTPKSNGNTTAVDYSLFSKLHATVSNLTGTASDSEGAYIEFKVRSTGKDDLNIKLREGENEIVFADWADKIDFGKLLEITLSGTLAEGSEAGSAVITDCYVYSDRYEYQTQKQTVYTRALGTALDLSSVVTNNSLVSIASTDGNILYGAYDVDGGTGNNIVSGSFETAFAKIDAAEAGKATYRYKITEATSTTDDGLVLPSGVTAVYCIQAFDGNGNLYRGPYWQDGYVDDLGWCTSVNKGDNGASFFAFTPIEGKENTYKISSYKKDGTLQTENYQGKTEYILNVIGETAQEVDVQVLVEVQVEDTEDPGVTPLADGWISLITNGDLSGDDVTNFRTKNEDGGEIDAVIDENGGRMNGRGIKVVSKDNATYDWGTQFFIKSSQLMKEGQKFHIEFDYRADRPANAATQAHCNPGEYNTNIGSIDFTVNWKHFSETYDVTAAMVTGRVDEQDVVRGMLSFGMNLSQDKNTNNFYFDNIVLWTEDDPCKAERTALQNAIALGKTQNSFAKTTESFGALTDAITAGEGVVESDDATTLTNAAKAITDAIAGFKLQDGYTNLTKDMFRQWNDNNTPTTSTAVNGAYVLNESTGQVFGEGNVYYKNFADISDFNKLYVLISAGEARVQMNRETDGGTTHIAYRSAAVSEVDFATATELSGFDFVHLNAIKDNWAGVTVSGMYLYRTLTVSDAGMASFGTLYKTANLSSADAVYGAKFEGDGVKLIPVDSKNVPAGVGVLVEGSDEIVPKFDVEAAEIDGNELKVSNGTVSGEGIYVLANKDKGLGFYKLAPDAKVPAGKAYLQVANGSREYIAIDGGATAIKSVEAENANGAIYNLAGQQVKNAQKGIFILNGKKVIK